MLEIIDLGMQKYVICRTSGRTKIKLAKINKMCAKFDVDENMLDRLSVLYEYIV